MARILVVSYLSLGACALLSVALVALYLDGRVQRKAIRVALSTIAALQQRIARDEQNGNLVMLLAPPEVAPEPEQSTGTSARQALLLPASTQRRAPSTIPRRTVRPDPNEDSPCPAARPTVRIPSGMNERIAERYIALCEASEARGVAATHCERGDCFHGTPSVCLCRCDACVRAIDCLVRAQREIATRNRAPDGRA